MAASAGPGTTGTPQHILLQPAAGDIRLTLYEGGDAKSRQQPPTISGTYTSGESVPTEDVPRRVRMFARGAGFSVRPPQVETATDWDGFAESSNACLRYGYICPSGEQNATVTVSTSWGAIRKIISFNGHLWFIFKSRIAYSTGAAGVALTDYYAAPGSDEFSDAEIWNGSLRIATLCTHTTTGIHFFVTATPSGASYAAAVNPTPASPGSTAATADTPQCRLFETAFWEYEGVAGLRLLGQTSDYEFKYMITPSGDPYDALNWGPSTQVGETTYQIRRMISSHDTTWFLKRDGVWAVTDKNAAAGGENLTPYWKEQLDPVDAMITGIYWGQWLVASHGLGVDLIDVHSWQVKDAPKPAHISYGRPNNSTLNGRYTAWCTDGGWLVGAMIGTSGAQVLYGAARQRASMAAGVTEVDWFSEVGPFTAGRDIDAMVVHTVAASGRPYLWLGMNDNDGYAYLVSVELFQGTSPLADSSHRYNTSASVTMTDEHWGARAATKGALRGELAVRNCGSTRKVDVYAVAGAGASFPGTATASVTTNVETSTFDMTSVRGSTIRAKLVLTSTATVPVVVDEFGLKANLGFPLRSRGSWLVIVGDEQADSDLPSFETPTDVEASLVALCESVEAMTVIGDEGETFTAVLKNILPWRKIDRSSNDLGFRQKDRILQVDYQVIG